MHSISIVVTASLAMFLPAKAANLAVEPRFLGGPCHPYGGYVQSMSTGNGMVQSLNIAITDTGTLLDNLTIKVGTIDVPQRGAYPYSYVTFYNRSDVAAYPVFCTDEDGLLTRPDGVPLRISTDSDNAVLVMRKLGGYGMMPEPYAHYVDGKRLDGTYLGLANRTTWAFLPEKSSDLDVWTPRLLLEKEELKQGEVRGYLKLWG